MADDKEQGEVAVDADASTEADAGESSGLTKLQDEVVKVLRNAGFNDLADRVEKI